MGASGGWKDKPIDERIATLQGRINRGNTDVSPGRAPLDARLARLQGQQVPLPPGTIGGPINPGVGRPLPGIQAPGFPSPVPGVLPPTLRSHMPKNGKVKGNWGDLGAMRGAESVLVGGFKDGSPPVRGKTTKKK